MPMLMTEEEFKQKYRPIPLAQLPERPVAKIEFEPIWEAPICSICLRKLKKADKDYITHKTFFMCENYLCRRTMGWQAAKVFPTSLKAVRVIYCVGRPLSRYYPGATLWDKIGEKRLATPTHLYRLPVVVSTFQTLYRVGAVTKEQYEQSARITYVTREYAPLSIVKEFHLEQIDNVFAKHGFHVFRPHECEPWRFMAYDVSELFLEQLYRDAYNRVVKLRIPAQSDLKIDSWFIITPVASVTNVMLQDSQGRPYSFPIGVDTAEFCIRVYSYRADKKVLIEEAIQKLNERLEELFRRTKA